MIPPMWAIVLISGALLVTGAIHVLVRRPQDRVRTSAATGDLVAPGGLTRTP